MKRVGAELSDMRRFQMGCAESASGSAYAEPYLAEARVNCACDGGVAGAAAAAPELSVIDARMVEGWVVTWLMTGAAYRGC